MPPSRALIADIFRTLAGGRGWKRGQETLTVDGHLNGHGVAFTLGVGCLADIHRRVIPVYRREQKRLPYAGHLRHTEALCPLPEDRGRGICIGQAPYLQLIPTLFQLTSRHSNQSRFGGV